MSRMLREGTAEAYTVNAEANAVSLDSVVWAQGSIQTAGALTINLYGSNYDDRTLTHVKVFDDTGNEATIVATEAGIWPIPDVISRCRFVKFVGAETAVQLFRKS